MNWIPPSFSHRFGLPILDFIYSLKDQPADPILDGNPFSWRGLQFKNRLGIAGGLDKNADYIKLWSKLGFGFSEFGTVTPLPQKANPGKILDRHSATQSLWNKMGFPNHGSLELKETLRKAIGEKQSPWLINLGKNRQTANDNAVADYSLSAERLKEFADAFVINVSSPNTQGLRDLQHANSLQKILRQTQSNAANIPLLVKLSPDLTAWDLEQSVLGAFQGGARGFVLTNTTLKRFSSWSLPADGGISGGLLKEESEKLLYQTLKILGPSRDGLLIISAGGVSDAQDFQRRLSMGADLVQIYSSFVFEGPRIVKKLLAVAPN